MKTLPVLKKKKSHNETAFLVLVFDLQTCVSHGVHTTYVQIWNNNHTFKNDSFCVQAKKQEGNFL